MSQALRAVFEGGALVSLTLLRIFLGHGFLVELEFRSYICDKIFGGPSQRKPFFAFLRFDGAGESPALFIHGFTLSEGLWRCPSLRFPQACHNLIKCVPFSASLSVLPTQAELVGGIPRNSDPELRTGTRLSHGPQPEMFVSQGGSKLWICWLSLPQRGQKVFQVCLLAS